MAEIVPKNQARSTLAVAVTSAGQVTLQMQTGDGAKFNSTGTYRVILWPAVGNTGPWEICTVTGGQGTDILTVTRASESVFGVQTAYSSWPIGTNIAAVLTQAGLTALLAAAGGGGGSATLTATVSNTSGSTIPAHTVVKWLDTVSNTAPEVAPITNTSTFGPETFSGPFGITTASISNNATGPVQCYGLLSGVDTSAWTAGTDIYADNSGALTSIASNIWVGIVTAQDVANGSIFLAGLYPTGQSAVFTHRHSNETDGGSHFGFAGIVPVPDINFALVQGWVPTLSFLSFGGGPPGPVSVVNLVDASGGAVSIALPDSTVYPLSVGTSNYRGLSMIFRKTDSSGNSVTLTNTSGSIDGVVSATKVLAAQGNWCMLTFDGSSGWWTAMSG